MEEAGNQPVLRGVAWTEKQCVLMVEDRVLGRSGV